MARRSNGIEYDTLKIPRGLTARIDRLIEKSNGDFTSRTDVVKYAVRLLDIGTKDKS